MNEYFVLDIDHTFGLQTETIHPVLLRDEQDLILIDCAYSHYLPQLKTAAEAKGIDFDTLTKVIITHHDHDHIGALAEIKAAYPNVEIYASEEQIPYIQGEKKSLRLLQAEAGYAALPENEKEEARMFMQMLSSIQPVRVDHVLEYEEPYPWCGGVQIIPTPGHMPGHISFYLTEFRVLLPGDALSVTNGKLMIANPQYTLDLAEAKESARKLLCYDIKKIVCYHGGVYEKEIKKALNDTMSLKDLITEVRNADNVSKVAVAKKVKMVYFSGTGGTAMVADAFRKELERSGKSVETNALDMQLEEYASAALIDNVDLLVVLYPVYAGGAPIPIFDWMESIPDGNGLSCAVISVSGGGEMWPNTASRIVVTDYLEVRGYRPFYERSVVMPANVFLKDKHQINPRLIRILPEKAEYYVNQMLSGNPKRGKKNPFAKKLLMNFSRSFRKNAYQFGQQLESNAQCNACGWCADNCPRKNIKINFGKPVFSDKCVMCFRCIYGCPQHAIETKKYKKFLIKGGFDLNRIREESGKEFDQKKIKGGLLYQEVKKYLKDPYR